MKFNSTRSTAESVSFKTAVLNGLTAQGGLYFPEHIPVLPQEFFNSITNYTDLEIAFQAVSPFMNEDLRDDQIKNILKDALNFKTPVVHVENNTYALELFHGPTKSFKDVGARFMSRCLSQFDLKTNGDVTILVATSGDTGSAVASGFYNVPGVAVKILFPKGMVSPYQENQMTTLGNNITCLEVDGTFDDCQRMVKDAFNDAALRKKVFLTSANSINVARLLPQMIYYFLSYKQMQEQGIKGDMVVAVPSGNLGNVTAGLVAKKMGLPIKRFIAAHNDNNTFVHFMKSGTYKGKPTVATISNAMDVGNPSNFERINYLYNGDVQAIEKDITAQSIDDATTLQEMSATYASTQYILDPHGAVGKYCLEKDLQPGEVGLFVETAHPDKFQEVVFKAIPALHKDISIERTGDRIAIDASYEQLKAVLLAD